VDAAETGRLFDSLADNAVFNSNTTAKVEMIVTAQRE